MRNAFRADADRAAACEKLSRGDKRFLVLSNVFTFVLPPIDRQRIEFVNEVTDDGHAKQRRLGEKRNLPRRKTQQEHRIDERVRMIEYENYRVVERNVFKTRDFD